MPDEVNWKDWWKDYEDPLRKVRLSLSDGWKLGVTEHQEGLWLGPPHLEHLWKRYWDEEISLVVIAGGYRESPTLVDVFVEPIKFEESLESAKPLARRILNAIALDSMAEERTFPGYRINVEQSIDRLASEADALFRAASAGSVAVDCFRKNLGPLTVLASATEMTLGKLIAWIGSDTSISSSTVDEILRTLKGIDGLAAALRDAAKLRERDDAADEWERYRALVANVAERLTVAERNDNGFAAAKRGLLELDPSGKSAIECLTNVKARVIGLVATANLNSESLLAVLESAKRKSRELNRLAQSKEFQNKLFDRLRSAWEQVDRQWGTWQKRSTQPIAHFLGALIFSLVMYAVLGSAVPTASLLTALFLFPTLAYYFRVSSGRKRLEDVVGEVRQSLDGLDPDMEQGADGTKSIWRARKPETAADEIQKAVSGKRKGEIKQADVMKTFLLWGVPSAFVLVGLLIYYLVYSWPRYDAVHVSHDGVSCSLGTGIVLWAGPGERVLWVGSQGLLIVPDVASVHLSRHVEGVLPRSPCDGQRRREGADQDVTVISNSATITSSAWFDGEGRTLRDTILLPAFFDRVPCDISPAFPEKDFTCEKAMKVNGGYPHDATVEALRELRAALEKCSVTRPVEIDVKGFASSKDFEKCPAKSEDLNLALAEARRANVMCLLGADLAASESSGSLWSHSKLQIRSPGIPRWRSIPEMWKDPIVDDKIAGETDGTRERLSRVVSIEIVDKGSCRP